MSQSKKDDTKAKVPVKAKSLIDKLVEILAELGPIAKSKRNPHFGYNYIGEGQLMAELRHRLSSRGVFLFTSVESIVPRYGEPKEGVFVCVQTRHTFVDAATNQQFQVMGAGVGWDSTDKGAYKAITGATKYALMKNFLVTDEQDPESEGDTKVEKPTAHKRTKPYEEETGHGDTKVATDMLVLKTFLTEHKIDEGFLLRLLQDKGLIDGHTKAVGQLKPGIVTRCIGDKSKANLLKSWQAYLADQDSGGATAPKGSVDAPSSAFTADEPPDLKANKGNGEVIRDNEGDQTRNVPRKPVQKDMSPDELLEQDGYDDWRQVPIHFGKQTATPLGKLTTKSLSWWVNEWKPKPYKGAWNGKDLLLDGALVLASKELSDE